MLPVVNQKSPTGVSHENSECVRDEAMDQGFPNALKRKYAKITLKLEGRRKSGIALVCSLHLRK
jgi:hypothetical protein